MWHPDRHGGAENAKRKFQSIQYAYEVLSNETRRAHYDLQWLDLLEVEVSQRTGWGGGRAGKDGAALPAVNISALWFILPDVVAATPPRRTT